MGRRFKIKTNSGKDKLPSYGHCWKCNKVIKPDTLFVDYGNGIYHLVCFHAYGQKLLKRWKLFQKNIEEDLNKLKPYNKEMICESLEDK